LNRSVSAEAPTRRSLRSAAPARRRWYARWWIWAIVAVILLAVAVTAWIGVRGLQAKQQLDGAMPLVTQLKAQLLAQDSAGVKATYAQLEPRVQKAESLTSDPIWRSAEVLPGVGPNLTVTRTLAGETDKVVTGAIKPLVDISGSLTLESLKPKDGHIDVAALTAMQPAVDKASGSVDSALAQLKKLNTVGAVGQLVSAKSKLETMLTPVGDELRQAKSILDIAPKVLGSDKPRNYLLAFQNNGELMPGGGTIGSMVIIHVDKGAIQLVEQSSAAPSEFPMYNAPVLPLPEDALSLYPKSLGQYVQDLTETPRFDLSFAIAKQMWKQAKGVDLDGIVAIDTVALSQFLAVTGPVALPDGTQLTSANAAQELLIGLYQKYASDQVDAVNQGLSSAVFAKLLAGDVDPKKLASFVSTASSQHRILLWSDDPAEQKAIRNSAFYGAPPRSTATTDAFGVYFRDWTPSKLGVYLKQDVKLSQAVCSAGGNVNVRVAVTLTNTAPASAPLPYYVSPADNHIRLRVLTYAPAGYTVSGVTFGYGGTGKDGDYVVPQAIVSLLPGQSQTVTFDLTAGHKDQRALTARVSPAVAPTTVGTGALDCGSFPVK
jgi:hypothetical protein